MDASTKRRWIVEFVVIVIGVLVALALEALWQYRSDRVDEDEAIQALLDEFGTSRERLSSSLQWPFIVVDSNSYSFDNSYSGRGTLVIQGNAKFNGDFAWDGVILIGGQLVSDGNQSIEGAIVAGLNLKRGGTPNATDLGNGTWSVVYHSCNILNALKGLGWPVEEPGTWHEVF